MRRAFRLFVGCSVLAFASSALMAQTSKKSPMNVAIPQTDNARIWQLDEGVTQLANEMAARIKKAKELPKHPRIAVQPLKSDKSETKLGDYLTKKLVTRIVNTEPVTQEEMSVLDREDLEKRLKELKLGEIGAFDASTAPRLGQQQVAEVLITGSYETRDAYFEIFIKAINCGTGRTIGSLERKIAWEKDLKERAEDKEPKNPGAAAKKPEPPIYSDKFWRIEIVSSEIKDGRIIVTVRVKNLGKRPQWLWVEVRNRQLPRFASLVSDNGMTWNAIDATLVDTRKDGIGGVFLGLSRKENLNVYQPKAERDHQIVFEAEKRPDKPKTFLFKTHLWTQDEDLEAANAGAFVQAPFKEIDVNFDEVPLRQK